jgi:hypothetical protein
LTASYTYDNEGHALTVQYPSYQVYSGSSSVEPQPPVAGKNVSYSRDAMGRLSYVFGGSYYWLYSPQYNAAGQMTSAFLMQTSDNYNGVNGYPT